MVDQVANFVHVTVSTGYDASATDIVLSSGEGSELPDPTGENYNLVWYDYTNYPGVDSDPNAEIIRVTAKSSDTITVIRNQEGSGASIKNTVDATYKMFLGPTAKTISDIENAIVGANRTAYVSPTFTEDEDSNRFTTIQSAIDWIHDSSWYSNLDAENKAVVLVYPGLYKEQLTSWEHIRIVSVADHDNLNKLKSAQLSIPDDKKTEAILVSGSAYSYNITGFTVKADSVKNGPYASSTSKAYFFNCEFEHGSFLDGTAAYACELSLYGCTFVSGTNALNYTGARGHADRTIFMFNTWSCGDIIINSTFATGSPSIKFKRCPMTCKTVIGGDWTYKMVNSRLTNTTGGANRNSFDTTGLIDIASSILSGGMHFASNPSSLSIDHCDFNENGATAITGADITADVDITNVTYNFNLQQNGIAGEIQIECPIKSVGCNSINRYYSVQDAINSIVTKGVIDIRESFTGLAELIIPASTNVTIDGHKLYSLTFSADIVKLNSSEQLVFLGLSNLNGGNIEVDGNSAYVGFEECLTVTAYVTLTSGTGSYCLVYTSTLKGSANHPAITINNTDTITVAGYSRIEGGTGEGALLYTVEADDQLKAKFSTFIHGDNAGNSPFENTSGADVNIAIYSSGLNAAWNPAEFTNTIGSAGNITDSQINF